MIRKIYLKVILHEYTSKDKPFMIADDIKRCLEEQYGKVDVEVTEFDNISDEDEYDDEQQD